MALEPGWYPDPDDGNLDRYWDGTAWATGASMTRGVSPRTGASTSASGDGPGTSDPRSAVLPPSAPLVAAGFVGLFLGLIIQAAGNAAAERAALNAGYFGDPSNEGLGIAVFGLVVVLVSLVALAVGLFRMAAGVDHLVRTSAARDR